MPKAKLQIPAEFVQGVNLRLKYAGFGSLAYIDYKRTAALNMNMCSQSGHDRHDERGMTILLVALAMVAILAMAALSIDVITLYLAKQEAQRSADAAALAAARVLSLSGVTGDPDNRQGSLPVGPWQAACGLATQVAQAVANQNPIGNTPADTVTVTFLYNGFVTDCTVGGAFPINPQVRVNVVRHGLPNLFSRIWNQRGNTVSATANAEAFNPSNSGSVTANGIVTVTPRCVKPWIVPNREPRNLGAPFVSLTDGSIQNPGIQPDGSGTGGVIGETFTLVSDCQTGNPGCVLVHDPPIFTANTLEYIPAFVQAPASAVPTCADTDRYQQAIGGCDQSTVYACGVIGGGTQADLTFDPGKPNGETAMATECLIHQPGGQDLLDTAVFPFRIQAGAGNALLPSGFVTSSPSIITMPIYDDTQPPVVLPVGSQPPVTIVGFAQVFINDVDSNGNLNVTVLNIAGCSDTATASTPTVYGSSPVPIRLITPQ